MSGVYLSIYDLTRSNAYKAHSFLEPFSIVQEKGRIDKNRDPSEFQALPDESL